MIVTSFGLSVIFGAGCASTVTTSTHTNKVYTRTDRARMLVEVANGALAEGDPTGALQSLLKAEQEDDRLPELYHSKALAFYAKHDLESAVESAQKAVEIKPNYADANNTLGKLLLDQGRFKDAAGPLQVAGKDPLYRESYKAWTNLGISEYRQGHFAQSQIFLDRAIQDSPTLSCIAHYYRGHINLKKQAVKEAIYDYRQATIKFCANFGDAQFALGLAYGQDKQYAKARKTFLEVQERHPRTALSERALAQLKTIP